MKGKSSEFKANRSRLFEHLKGQDNVDFEALLEQEAFSSEDRDLVNQYLPQFIEQAEQHRETLQLPCSVEGLENIAIDTFLKVRLTSQPGLQHKQKLKHYIRKHLRSRKINTNELAELLSEETLKALDDNISNEAASHEQIYRITHKDTCNESRTAYAQDPEIQELEKQMSVLQESINNKKQAIDIQRSKQRDLDIQAIRDTFTDLDDILFN